MVETDIMELYNSVVMRRHKLKQSGKLAFSLLSIRDKLTKLMSDPIAEKYFQTMLDNPYYVIISLSKDYFKSHFGEDFYYSLKPEEIEYIINHMNQYMIKNYDELISQAVTEVKKKRRTQK
jgi:hypothetical protein